MNSDLKGILIDLGDFTKNRLLPLILIIAVFVLLWRFVRSKPRS